MVEIHFNDLLVYLTDYAVKPVAILFRHGYCVANLKVINCLFTPSIINAILGTSAIASAETIPEVTYRNYPYFVISPLQWPPFSLTRNGVFPYSPFLEKQVLINSIIGIAIAISWSFMLPSERGTQELYDDKDRPYRDL